MIRHITLGRTLKLNKIPFNRPYLTGRELAYIAEAHLNGQLSGDGPFTHKCQAWLESLGPSPRALLTHSCTAALEMAALLCDLKPGDEVIMPSYTFVSTANAFVLRGAIPVFVDIRPDTLNIDETKIEAAITKKTRAIVPVHYAGVACEMDEIMAIAERYGLIVIEDAAQACLSTYKNRRLGTIGHFGCFSFHETKNISCGEGGALLINRGEWVERAEIIREKGTDRSRFFRGQVDKYTWRDVGSSYLPGELVAAFLWAQLEQAFEITERRREIWRRYDDLIGKSPCFRKPHIPAYCSHNAHMYYLINQGSEKRDQLIQQVKDVFNVHPVSHYEPLHESPFYASIQRHKPPRLPITSMSASRLLRLPLWIGLTETDLLRVAGAITFLSNSARSKFSQNTKEYPALLEVARAI